jgi:hypothetical protein
MSMAPVGGSGSSVGTMKGLDSARVCGVCWTPSLWRARVVTLVATTIIKERSDRT